MNSIDAIKLGINKGKKIRKARRIININLLVILVIMTSFTTAVNVSPSFASSMSEFPILKDIVDFIHIGSGYKEVYERGYYQEGYTILEDDKHTLKLESYFYSSERINLIINLNNLEKDYMYMLEDLKIFNDKSEVLHASSINAIFDDSETFNVHLDNFDDIEEESRIIFSVSKRKIRNRDNDFTLVYENIELNLKKTVDLESKEIELNESFSSGDIKFNFNNLIISPSKMSLEYEVESDSMKFFGFNEIYFKSKEAKYEKIYGLNGLHDSNFYTTSFVSPYFIDDRNLILVINGYSAIPIENSEILVDLKNKRIVSENLDEIRFVKIKEKNDEYILILESDVGINLAVKSEHSTSGAASFIDDKIIYEYKLNKASITSDTILLEVTNYTNLIEFNKIIEIKGNGNVND